MSSYCLRLNGGMFTIIGIPWVGICVIEVGCDF